MKQEVKLQCKLILLALLNIVGIAIVIIAFLTSCASSKSTKEVNNKDEASEVCAETMSATMDSAYLTESILIDSVEYIYHCRNYGDYPDSIRSETIRNSSLIRVKAYGVRANRSKTNTNSDIKKESAQMEQKCSETDSVYKQTNIETNNTSWGITIFWIVAIIASFIIARAFRLK